MEEIHEGHHATGKLASIQFLRALAAIMVLYEHSVDIQAGFGPSFQKTLFLTLHSGAMGVDIFFVISGFIITWSAGKWAGGREGRRFLSHRFVRLVPLYWIATLIFFILQAHHMHKTGSLPSVAVIVKTITLLPVIDRAHFITPLMSLSWTLSFEWLFYLLIFAVIVLSVRRKTFNPVSVDPRRGVRWQDLGWPAIPSLPGTISLPGKPHAAGISAGYLDLRGLLLPNLRGLLPPKITRLSAGLLVVAAIGMILYEMKVGYTGIYWVDKILTGEWAMTRFLLWGIPSALLVAGCVFGESNGSVSAVFENRFILLLGDASYSMYLTHLTVYGLITAVYTRWGFFLNGDLAVFVQLFAAIAGGILFYRWVEVPLLKKLRGSRKKKTDSGQTSEPA